MFLLRKRIISNLRFYSEMVSSDNKATTVHLKKLSEEWRTAKPYSRIPGPSIFFLLRNYMPDGELSNLDFLEAHKILRKNFGPIYKLKGIFGKRDMVVVDDPKDFEALFQAEGPFPIRRGMDAITYYRKEYRKDHYSLTGGIMCEQGEAWWDLRQKLNGVIMKPDVINEYTSGIDEISSEFAARLKKSYEGQSDLYYQLNKWALENIGYITMNQRWGLLEEKPNEQIRKLLEYFQILIKLLFELDFQPSLYKIFKTFKFKYFLQTYEMIENIIEELFEESLKKLNNQHFGGEDSKIQKCVFEKLLKIDQRVAKLMIFDLILTGIDTTSSSTLALLYYLAKNPEKQEILRKELLKVLPKKDSLLTEENMKNLPYLRACIKESVRMMPVLSGQMRAPIRNIVLSGYQIPKNTDVFMPNETLYRKECYFTEPNSFIPERWLRESEKCVKINPYVYLPFGYGRRICVGRRIAQLEMETLTSRLIRNFYLEWHHPPPKIRSTTVNIPYGDLKLQLKDYN